MCLVYDEVCGFVFGANFACRSLVSLESLTSAMRAYALSPSSANARGHQNEMDVNEERRVAGTCEAGLNFDTSTAP